MAPVWWYRAADTVLIDWIGLNKSSDVGRHLESFRSNDRTFWSATFIDGYMPSQPSLLCAATVLGLASAVLLVMFLMLCAAKMLGIGDGSHGASYYSSSSFISSYFHHQAPSWMKVKGPKQWSIPLAGLCVIWLFLFVVATIFILCLNDFTGRAFKVDEREKVDINEKVGATALLEKSAGERRVFVGPDSVSVHDDGSRHFRTRMNDEPVLGELGDSLLSKFDDIRELGYEFKPMERESASLAKYLVLVAVLLFYSVCLVVLAGAVVIGIRSVRQHKSEGGGAKNMGRSAKTLAAVAVLLLAASPFSNALATLLVVHTHAHSAICPHQQTTAQNANIEDYVNENYSSFDPIALVDFLADLGHERSTVNEQNCRENIHPLEGIWLCLLAFAWLSLPVAFFATWMSRNLSRQAKSTKVPPLITTNWATAYAPPNYYHDQQQPDKSPYTFGTFVYQKKY